VHEPLGPRIHHPGLPEHREEVRGPVEGGPGRLHQVAEIGLEVVVGQPSAASAVSRITVRIVPSTGRSMAA
jgi:hypothetical protein